jgi:magnesium chelatase subunit I
MPVKSARTRARGPFRILPYSRIVGQEELKKALELAFIDPEIRGVLLSGERGTAKSTAVRAFSQMMYGTLPTTLPMNATEDRVVGGWRIDELMRSRNVWQDGLLQEADKKLLYVDEINLLDDHLVNIILDVASTDVLVVQREGKSLQTPVHFTLVGTMNPEEGGLRPQLLDRFGLMVDVPSEKDEERRIEILETLLRFDRGAYAQVPPTDADPEARKADGLRKRILLKAQTLVRQERVGIPDEVKRHCVRVSRAFNVEGHRGEHVMALAARAHVARAVAEAVVNNPKQPLPSKLEATIEDVVAVARLAIQHRRRESLRGEPLQWREEDTALLRNPVPSKGTVQDG